MSEIKVSTVTVDIIHEGITYGRAYLRMTSIGDNGDVTVEQINDIFKASDIEVKSVT